MSNHKEFSYTHSSPQKKTEISFQQQNQLNQLQQSNNKRELTLDDLRHLQNSNSGKKNHFDQNKYIDGYRNQQEFQELQQQKNKKNIFDTATFEQSDSSDFQLRKNEQFTNSLASNPNNNNKNPINKHQSATSESDFDLSQSKLKQLGLDQNKDKYFVQNQIDEELQNYSSKLKNYQKQFQNMSEFTQIENINPFTQPQTQNNSSSNNNRANSNGGLSSNQSINLLNKYGHYLSSNNTNIYIPNPHTQQQNNTSGGNNNSFSTQTNYNNPNLLNYQTNNLEGSALKEKLKTFNKQLQEVHEDFSNSKFSADPYKMSLHSINSLNTIKKEIDSQSTPYQQEAMNSNNFQQSSNKKPKIPLSNYNKPPVSNLAKLFGKEENYKKNHQKSNSNSYQSHNNNNTNNQSANITNGSHLDNLEIHKIKYYDSFMPNNLKILNSPFKLLKYKIQNRDKTSLQNCMQELSYINKELTSNLFDKKFQL